MRQNFETGHPAKGLLDEAWRIGSAGLGTVEFSQLVSDFRNLRNQPAHRESVLRTIKGRLRVPNNNVAIVVDADSFHQVCVAQVGIIYAMGDETLACQTALVSDEPLHFPEISPSFGTSDDETARLEQHLSEVYALNQSLLLTVKHGALEADFMTEHFSFYLPLTARTQGNQTIWHAELPISEWTFSKKTTAVLGRVAGAPAAS